MIAGPIDRKVAVIYANSNNAALHPMRPTCSKNSGLLNHALTATKN
jgi:hypothetical protein